MSAQSIALTEAHRVAQTQVSATTAYLMLRLFAALDPADVEGTVARWLRLVIPALRRQHANSMALAVAYLGAMRRLELGPDVEPFTPVLPEFNEEKVVTSLMVTGPRELEKAREQLEKTTDLKGEPWIGPGDPLPKRIMEQAAGKVAGSAMRHVRDAERATIYDTVAADPLARGYMRVSDGDPCYFCAVLVSRGPVYKEDSFEESDERFHGPGKHKVHDNCGCTVRPVYGNDVSVPDQTKELDELWKAVTAPDENGRPAHSGKDAIREFRRRLEGRSDEV